MHFHTVMSPDVNNQVVTGIDRKELLKTSVSVSSFKASVAKRATANAGDIRLIDGHAPSDPNDEIFHADSVQACSSTNPSMGGVCKVHLEVAVGYPATAEDAAKAFIAVLEQEELISSWEGMPPEWGTIQVSSKPTIVQTKPSPKKTSPLFMISLALALLVLLAASIRALQLAPDTTTTDSSQTNGTEAAQSKTSLKQSMNENKAKIAKITVGLVDMYTDLLFVAEVYYVSRVREEFSIFFVGGVLFTILPIIAGLVASLLACISHASLLHKEIIRDNAILYALCVILSSINVEALVVLPWTQRLYDGFPVKYMLGLTYVTVLLEDIPQFVLQLFYVRKHGQGGIALYSLAFTVASLSVRVIARALVMLMSDDGGDGVEGRKRGGDSGRDDMEMSSTSNATNRAGRLSSATPADDLWVFNLAMSANGEESSASGAGGTTTTATPADARSRLGTFRASTSNPLYLGDQQQRSLRGT